MALTTDTSILTAVANDYGYAAVFERQVQALAQAGDVLVAISTSGNSENIARAAKAARDKGCVVIGLTGKSGGRLVALSDQCVVVPYETTALIQELHITIGHIWCGAVDESLTSSES